VLYGGSRGKRGIYGTGTLSSGKGHHLGDGAMELASQTDLEEFSTSSNTTNNFWVEPRRQKTSTSDSEAGVFGLKSL
jgi:hypothetical protein